MNSKDLKEILKDLWFNHLVHPVVTKRTHSLEIYERCLKKIPSDG